MRRAVTSLPSHVRLVVYDLDGTLLDAFEDILNALNHALTHFGLPTYGLDAVKQFVGDGVEVFIKRALKDVPRYRMREVRDLFIAGYSSPARSTARVYPGTIETLRELRRLGLLQAVLTNKPHPIAISSCDHVGIGPIVDHVQGTDPDHPLKPDPRGLLRILDVLGVDPSTTIFVGDGRPDMEVACAAGVAAVGCSWGTQSPAQLIGQGAVRVVDSLAEILPLLRDRSLTSLDR
jgi:phosphoglycolate phosphatase